MFNQFTVLDNKSIKLFVFLGAFFLANALLAEFIGVKIFSLEKVFGFETFEISILGEQISGINLTAGVLLWPVVFIMTDIINEYYGTKGVKFFSYIAAGLIGYAFVMCYIAIQTSPADFWITRQTPYGIIDMELAFRTIFGQGNWIIIGSLVAFLIGQLIDVKVFHLIKRLTGERFIWLRATGSTLISQLIDSFVVLFIAFYIGAGWSLTLVLAIGVVNYIYKSLAAVILTPALYLAHYLIDNYLGKETATQLRKQAMAEKIIS